MGLRLGTTEPKIRWRKIVGFPNYTISEEGQVKNIKTGRILKVITDEYGSTHFVIYSGGKAHNRGVKKLMKEAFGTYFE